MIQSGNKFIDDNNNISVTVIYVSYMSVFVAWSFMFHEKNAHWCFFHIQQQYRMAMILQEDFYHT